MEIEVVREYPVNPPVKMVVLRLSAAEFDVLRAQLEEWCDSNIPCIRSIIEYNR